MPPARKLRAVPDNPNRVVAYIRVSALMGRGGEDFHSPEIQLGAIRRSIAMAGLREVAVIDDDIDQTGRHFDREGIDKVREMAEARQVDAVAVYDLSRLGRNVLESLQFIKWLADRGVGVISSCENVDTSTPAGRLMLTNFLSIAQFRSDEIGRHWSAIITRRAEQGLGHGRAMGYIKKDRHLFTHPIEGPAMAQAFEQYAEGLPIGEVARQLAVTIGRNVYTSQLKKQFSYPVYRGQVVSHGQVFPGEHEPLVGQETWELVQDRKARERTMPSRHLGPTWSLVGLIFCPNDHHLQRNPVADKHGGPKVNRLKCHRGTQRGVIGRCSVGRPQLALVEEEVLRQVRDYLRLLRDDVAARAARLARSANARVEKANLDEQLRNVRSAMSRIAKEWALNRLPDAAYQETMTDLRDSETALLTAVAAANRVVQLPSPTQMADAGERLLLMWPRMTAAEKGLALRQIVQKIVVRGPSFYREPEADRVDVSFF